MPGGKGLGYTFARMNSRARPTVCHVLHSLHIGGGELLARDIAKANEAEFRPVFALLDDIGHLGHELLEQGYTVRMMDRRAGLDLRCARHLGRMLRRER